MHPLMKGADTSQVSHDELQLAIMRLHRWQYIGGTNFTAQLYDLIAKADSRNKEKIAKGFPAEAMAYAMLYASGDPQEFFKFHGLE